MNPRLSLTATLVVALAAASTDSRFVGTGTQMSPSDSAMAEFEAGRFWHAARMMRDEGAATGEAMDFLRRIAVALTDHLIFVDHGHFSFRRAQLL